MGDEEEQAAQTRRPGACGAVTRWDPVKEGDVKLQGVDDWTPGPLHDYADLLMRLVLKGRYQPKHCESLLRKYIKEYVTCEMCKSAATTLRKDGFWGKTASASIKAGFHAVTRGDRKAAKQAK
eukprot:g18493.t1